MLLRALADKAPLTYTCLPVGSGYRIALDADLDGCFNVDEAKAGTDPRDGGSSPPCDDGDGDSDGDSDSDSDSDGDSDSE